MAKVNGKKVNFYGLNMREVGEKILVESGSVDGQGIVLELSAGEETAFEAYGGLNVGYLIANLLAIAVKKKTGERPRDIKYVYHNLVFTT